MISALLSLGLGMAMGSSLGDDEATKKPRSGLVPLVEWPDGAKICRVVGNVHGDLLGWDFQDFYGDRKFLYFVYTERNGDVNSHSTVEKINGSLLVTSVSRVDEQARARWIWFLFSVLGLEMRKWNSSLGNPVQGEQLGVLMKDLELVHGIRNIEEAPDLYQNREDIVDPIQRIQRPDYLSSKRVHYYRTLDRWKISFTELLGTILAVEISIVLFDSKWHIEIYRNEIFISKEYTSFWEMIKNHLYIENTNEAIDEWLNKHEEPGKEVYYPGLEAFELLMDCHPGLMDNETFDNAVVSQGIL